MLRCQFQHSFWLTHIYQFIIIINLLFIAFLPWRAGGI